MTGRRRVCLFAQFSAGPRLPAYVLHSWRALCDAGFEVHAALSGRTELDRADREMLATGGVTAWLRPNAGLDFGAWAALVAAGVAADADEILLANDSVLGPFEPLAPVMRRMAGYDAWGMVLSREGRPHLQSWFVLMTRAAFERPAVRRVFALDFAAMGKDEIIVHGELGLSAAFAAEGLDVGARWRSEFRLRPAAMIATNPMHFRWRQMLDAGVPFLKRELVERNPARIIDAGAWRAALRARGWEADWTRDIPDAAAPPRALGVRQSALQIMVREDRWRLLRARLS